MESVISIQNLTRRFGSTVAVDNLTLEIHAGEVFGFLGHNGAGKTTTVRLINGILTPNGGTIRVLGMDPTREGAALRRRTGVLTETPSLDDRLTGRESLSIYADLYAVPSPQVERRVTALLTTFELMERAHDRVGSYSRGMRQRLALARAILHNPEVVFLDEPTAGLDPVVTRQVHRLIEQLSERGHTVFLCTHNLTEAQSLCDRVAVLEQGRLLALGTPADLGRQLGRSLRLELEVAPEDMAITLTSLQTASPCTVLSHNAYTVTVQGADRASIPIIVRKLVQAGVRLYQVVPQEPSLEDVYFALHEGQEVAQ